MLGATTNCYIAVVRGPMVWTAQPRDGEFPPIRLPAYSSGAWQITDASSMSNAVTWASQVAHDVAEANPICGDRADYENNQYPGTELWVLP